MSESITLQERLTPGFRVDREKRLVENVCLLSAVSKNGYEYSDAARKQVVPLYANRPVYLDHAENPAKRSIRELAGRVVNPRISEGKPYGDIKVARGGAGDTFLSLAEDQAEDPDWCDVGMSHVVKGRKSKNGKVVEAIEQVLSVDLVAGPATTTNLREKTEETQVELLEKLKPLLSGAKSAVERLKAIYEACGVEFKEAEQVVPEQLTIETVDELRAFAKDRPTLTKFIEKFDEMQRHQWMTEAMVEAKLPDSDSIKNVLKRCGTKELMVEHAKVLAETIKEHAVEKPKQAGRTAPKDSKKLEVNDIVEAFRR